MLSHLFLYNSLKTGGKYHKILQLHKPIRIGMAKVEGYALWKISNEMCMAVQSADHRVYGELWVVPPSALVRLDAFEDVGRGAFERLIVPIVPLKTIFRDKKPIWGDMYVWQHGTEHKDYELVKDGIWL